MRRTSAGWRHHRGLITIMGGEEEFSPLDVTSATAELWWAMWDSSTLFQDSGFSVPAGDGNDVGGILDKSGKSRAGTQATTAAKGVLHTNELNGQPILRFDGTDDFYDLALTFVGLTASEMFLVIKASVAVPLANVGFWDIGLQASTTLYPDTSGNIRDSYGSTTRQTIAPSANIAQYHIYNVITTGSEWTANINNSQEFTTATNTVGWEATTAKIGNSLTSFLNADIAEWIVYDGKLSTLDHASVNNYLASLYGVTSL